MLNERYKDIVDNINEFTYHILGCGAIGSSTATQLARMGAEEFVLCDFDRVEIENVGVSQYIVTDIGKNKVAALKDHIKLINPRAKVITMSCKFDDWWESDRPDIVILGFDSMASRLDAVTRIVNKGKKSLPYAIIDGRMGAEHYQQYTYNKISLERYLKSWYSDEDGDPEPCSAKATSYCSNMSGSFIVNTIRKLITGQPFDNEVSFNFPTMMIEIK